MTLNDIPKNKTELVEIMTNPKTRKKITQKPYKSYEPQYISYWLTQNEVYTSNVTNKQYFEPYFVAHRSIILYDEIFNGCGYDKLSHVDNLRNLGYKLKMVPDSFIIHLSHNDLKNYSNWCKGYKPGKRYWLKVHSFRALAYRLMGFLKIVHYPSWLQSENLEVPSHKVCMCKNNEVHKMLAHARRRVVTLGNAAKLLTLGLFVLVAIAVMVANKTKKLAVSEP